MRQPSTSERNQAHGRRRPAAGHFALDDKARLGIGRGEVSSFRARRRRIRLQPHRRRAPRRCRDCRAAAAGALEKPAATRGRHRAGVAKKRRSGPGPRHGRPSRCSTAAVRRAASVGHRASSSRAWVCAKAAMSVARRSQRTSGWRRTMPDALQGASSRMASKGRPSHQDDGSPASAARHRACRPSRASDSSHLTRRAASLSSASTSRSASSSRWAVLPPGAAQASRTRAPAGRRWLAPSSAQQQGRGALGGGVLHRDIAVVETREPLHRARLLPAPRPAAPRLGPPCRRRQARRGSRRHRRGAALTRSVIGGCCWSAWSRACQCSGQSRAQASTHQAGG